MGGKHFFNLTQDQLNNLASMMPMVLDLVRSPGKATIFINNMSEDDVSLVRSLTDFQFSELREIQGLIESAMRADNRNKLNLYLECIERAPWHCHALRVLEFVII
ncbi:MAG: hypothetical protein IPG99_08060 [Ignavibacteria bacterium]|nr:hypothetical protein [Ignavibacteria bacterium]